MPSTRLALDGDITRRVLDVLPSMVAFWDRDLRCRFANRAYETWFGVDPRQMLGRTLAELLGPDLYALNEGYARAALAGEVQVFERAVPGPGGVLRHSLAHYLPMRDGSAADGPVIGFAVQVTEVTALHQAREALRAQVAAGEHAHARLREREAALRQAQQLGNIGSWEWEVDADIVSWSDQLYAIFGRHPGSLPPSFSDHAQLYAPASWATLQNAVAQTLATAQPYQLELQYRRPDGAAGWIEARGSARTDAAGRVVALHGTAQEISARHEMALVQARNRELAGASAQLDAERDRNAELERALLQARKLEALGLLAGGIAHDFNNVLAAVSGSLQVIKLTAPDSRAQDAVERGLRGVQRATRLVRQLMAFSRTQRLEPQTIDLQQAIANCADMLQMSVGTAVRLQVEPGPVAVVLIDVNQLEMALLNLAINARDAMPGGGTLRISVAQRGQQAVLQVQDNGSGMPPEVLAQAREPFFTTKPSGEGTGLGLAMVAAFAGQSGGTLEIDSTPGQGSTVSLVLPLAQRPADAQPAQPAQPIDRSQHGRATLLLVDDDALVRPVLAAQLADLGYTVLQADGAAQALAQLHGTAAIDLLVTDVAMHGMDGMGLAAEARRLRPGLPVLVITGMADHTRLTGEVVLDKPFSQHALAQRVLQLLGRQAVPQGRLAGRIRQPEQRALYLDWTAARGPMHLPELSALELQQRPGAGQVFIAEVLGLSPFTLRRTHLGAGLAAQWGQAAALGLVSAGRDDLFGGLEAAYHRCLREQEATYESMRFALDAGRPVTFERLLLPCEDAASGRRQLVGMVHFQNLNS